MVLELLYSFTMFLVGKRVNIAELMISSGLAEVRQASRQSELVTQFAYVTLF